MTADILEIFLILLFCYKWIYNGLGGGRLHFFAGVINSGRQPLERLSRQIDEQKFDCCNPCIIIYLVVGYNRQNKILNVQFSDAILYIVHNGGGRSK